MAIKLRPSIVPPPGIAPPPGDLLPPPSERVNLPTGTNYIPSFQQPITTTAPTVRQPGSTTIIPRRTGAVAALGGPRDVTKVNIDIPITTAELQRIQAAKDKGLCVGTMKTYYTVKTYKVTLAHGGSIYVEALDKQTAKDKASAAGYNVAWVGRYFGLPPAKTTPSKEPTTMAPTKEFQANNVKLADGTWIPKTTFTELKTYDTQHGTNYTEIAQTKGYTALQAAIGRDTAARGATLSSLDKYKTTDGYNLLKARIDGVSTETMRLAGFDNKTCQLVEDSYQTSVKTGVALPSNVTWEDTTTGKIYTDAEYKKLLADWDAKWKAAIGNPEFYELPPNPRNTFHLSTESGRRLLIEGASSLFFAPAAALLPEVRVSDIQPITWAVGGAQLATWAMPVIPKGVLPFVSAGGAGIFGYSTAKNWDKLNTGQKALSVAGTVLVSLPALSATVKFAGPSAVKVPTSKGTEITVWRGVQVNGKPMVGISEGKVAVGELGIKRPAMAQIEEGWHPVTKIETTLMGTENSLRKMGVAEADIAKVKAVWAEAVPSFARKPTPARIEASEILAGSQRLTPEETAAILKVSVKTPKVKMVYGSSTMRPQLKEALRDWRQWHDIDIQTSMTSTELDAYVANIMKELRKVGTKVRVNPEQPGTIEKAVGGKWEKITDIHTFEESVSSLEAAEGAYGYLYAEKPITIKLPGIGKLKIMTLSETGLRKAGSITSFQVSKIAPAAHRINDIADFYTILLNYKGPKAASEWARAFGYTERQLAEVAAKNPARWSTWSVSPSAAGRGLPLVSVSIPAALAGKVSPSLRANIKGYSPMVNASSYSVSVSPTSKPISPSQKVSRSLVAKPSPSPSVKASRSPSPSPRPSPSVSPSISPKLSRSISPSPSPKASPSPVPSPSPRPSPSPYPSPIPSPSPSPYLSPHPSPKPWPYKPLKVSPQKQMRREGPALAVWKQGRYWVSIFPPFRTTGRQEDVVYSLKRPSWGSVIARGRHAPKKTLKSMGKIPRVITVPMGVVTARITDGRHLTFSRRTWHRGRVIA